MDLVALWRRPDARFLGLFVLILLLGFTAIALRPVNDAVVLPFTSMVARVSAALLTLLGQETTAHGCVVSSPRFSVTIYNGCNGLITSLVFVAAVLAFPAGTKRKLIGVTAGLLAIQTINLVRIISLYFIGAYAPEYFNQAHVFVWQSLVILAGVVLWVSWARHHAKPRE